MEFLRYTSEILENDSGLSQIITAAIFAGIGIGIASAVAWCIKYFIRLAVIHKRRQLLSFLKKRFKQSKPKIDDMNLTKPKEQIKQEYSQKVLDLMRRADNGDSEAQYQLGFIYEYGKEGLAKDVEEAGKWYKKAAAQGDISAETALHYLYMEK